MTSLLLRQCVSAMRPRVPNVKPYWMLLFLLLVRHWHIIVIVSTDAKIVDERMVQIKLE